MSSAVELKFGTSGLRGLGKDLDRETCYAYVGAFLAMLDRRGQSPEAVCIGFDLRASSTSIALYCAEAVAARGLRVINAGPVPTPALARYALKRGLPALMITASHNPPEHNGIKFYRPDGELGKADEEPIRAGLGAALPEPRPLTPPPLDAEVTQEYAESFRALFGGDALAGLRLGVDQHSAVGRDLLVDILQSLGAECTVTRRSATFVAVDTEAVDTDYLEMARGWLIAGGFDAIVSTDGDGDRPLLMDHLGQFVRGDVLGLLAAKYLDARVVVTPVTSNSSVEQHSPSVVRTRVGSPYVVEAMAGAGPGVVGFEANGGTFVGEGVGANGHALAPLATRDAILPLLCAFGAAAAQKQSVADMVAGLKLQHALADRLQDVPQDRSTFFLERLTSEAGYAESVFGSHGITRRAAIDGLQFWTRAGDMVHFRASGNAPELRCYVEAGSADAARQLLDWGLAAARRELGL